MAQATFPHAPNSTTVHAGATITFHQPDAQIAATIQVGPLTLDLYLYELNALQDALNTRHAHPLAKRIPLV